MKTIERDRPSSISVICGNSRWLGDGDPTWIEGRGKRWQRSCNTLAQTNQMRCDAIRLLRHHAPNNARTAVVALADRLDACSPRQPCTSGACAVCGRAVHRWFVRCGNRLIEQLGATTDATDLLMVTISPDFGQIPIDQMASHTVHTIVAKLRHLLRSAGVDIAFGGIDFSVNCDGDDRRDYVQVHACLIVPRSSWPRPDRKLRLAMNKSRVVRRPINIKQFDGDSAGLAYALKYQFNRRVRYQQSSDTRRDNRCCSNTRTKPLRGCDWVKLMLFIDELGLSERIFLIGIKRIMKAKEINMRLLE